MDSQARIAGLEDQVDRLHAAYNILIGEYREIADENRRLREKLEMAASRIAEAREHRLAWEAQ